MQGTKCSMSLPFRWPALLFLNRDDASRREPDIRTEASVPALTILLHPEALTYLQTRLSRDSQTAEPQGPWPQGKEVPPQE